MLCNVRMCQNHYVLRLRLRRRSDNIEFHCVAAAVALFLVRVGLLDRSYCAMQVLSGS